MKLDLFTPCCHYCNKRISRADDIFCIECQGNLPYTSFELSDRDNIIKSRFRGLVDIDRAGALLYYLGSDMVQNILYQIKYNSNLNLAVEMGRKIGQKWSPETIDAIDAIVPIPLHTSKRAQRGYNQCEHIAKGISIETEIPVNTKLIKRIKATKSQTKLSKAERLENMKGAFELQEISSLKNRHIVLIDDVITTGTTLEFAAKEIQKSEIKNISIYTLATAFEL